MKINPKSIEKLQSRLKSNPLKDDSDLVEFVALASRLKVLGDTSFFDRIPEIAEQPEFSGRLDTLLLEHCEKGIANLKSKSGKSLVRAIIAAQDLWLYRSCTKGTALASPTLFQKIFQWTEETSNVRIREKTAGMLKHWLHKYPIAKKYRLPVVHAPITDWEYQALGQLLSRLPRKTTSLSWKKQNGQRPIWKEKSDSWSHYTTKLESQCSPASKVPPQSLVCDDGTPTPTDDLLEAQFRLCCFVPEENLVIHRSLNDAWELVIEIDTETETPLQIRDVRVGLIKAEPSPQKSNRWIVDMGFYPQKMRLVLLYEKTVIRLDFFHDLSISFPEEK